MAVGETKRKGTNSRPETWTTLFVNEIELARAHYQLQAERHRLICDKAKVTFTVAGLVTALGLAKLADLGETGPGLPMVLKWCLPTFAIVGHTFVAYAVFKALEIFTAHEFKAPSGSKRYVEEVHGESEDIMNRSLADVYQRAADENGPVNNEIARILNVSINCLRVGLALALLAWLMYAIFAVMFPRPHVLFV